MIGYIVVLTFVCVSKFGYRFIVAILYKKPLERLNYSVANIDTKELLQHTHLVVEIYTLTKVRSCIILKYESMRLKICLGIIYYFRKLSRTTYSEF
jgi:hypothetical protein